MPLIRSDDGPRKLRAVWLGPKGATLPFEWAYAQWLVCILFSMVCGAIALVTVWAVWAPIYGLAAAVMYGIPAGFYLGAKAMNGVSYDEPISYRARMARDQLRHRPAVTDEPQTINITLPPITDLSPGILRAWRWKPDPTTAKESHVEASKGA